MILGSGDGYGKWTELDTGIMQAYQIWKGWYSLPHGVPTYLAFRKDGDIGFDLIYETDHAQAKLDKAQHDEQKKQQKAGEKYRPKYGARPVVKAVSYFGEDLTSDKFKDEFNEQRAEDEKKRREASGFTVVED